jgi:elongation factor P hydroxylase
MDFNISDLKIIFEKTFGKEYNIELIYGAEEPFYKASNSIEEKNQLICREDFFASALHEISHWCVAGTKRRKMDDFGYWYNPDGRNLEQQKSFEEVEVKPQAIELAFSEACKYPFKVSVDNLSLEKYDATYFNDRVNDQYKSFKLNGFPKRANLFIFALKNYYSSL